MTKLSSPKNNIGILRKSWLATEGTKLTLV